MGHVNVREQTVRNRIEADIQYMSRDIEGVMKVDRFDGLSYEEVEKLVQAGVTI